MDWLNKVVLCGCGVLVSAEGAGLLQLGDVKFFFVCHSSVSRIDITLCCLNSICSLF